MISQTTFKHITTSCIFHWCWKGNPVILLLLDAEVPVFISCITYTFDLQTTQESETRSPVTMLPIFALELFKFSIFLGYTFISLSLRKLKVCNMIHASVLRLLRIVTYLETNITRQNTQRTFTCGLQLKLWVYFLALFPSVSGFVYSKDTNINTLNWIMFSSNTEYFICQFLTNLQIKKKSASYPISNFGKSQCTKEWNSVPTAGLKLATKLPSK